MTSQHTTAKNEAPVASDFSVEAMNALRAIYPHKGGYLTNLVCNVRNTYLKYPESSFTGKTVQMLTEGFMAEVGALQSRITELERQVADLTSERDALIVKIDTTYCEACAEREGIFSHIK